MADDDDWDVDLDAINNVSSIEARWGGTVGGSVDDTSSLSDLRSKVLASDKAKKDAVGSKFSYGYGGKFGVEKDRMDKSAVDNSYKPEATKHTSVAAGKSGYGGKFGVQSDRQDKSAVDFSYKPSADKHASQKDYKTGFGGKFGVQKDRQDACAETWDYKQEANKHSSQTDASKGFGGKFGVQEDRKDASAHGWTPERKVAPVKPKPKSDANVSVGNIKSMFEKPVGADVSETIAKHRAARAEQDRKERELQARQKPVVASNDDVERGTKTPNRAEEARQLVAQSRVSAAASQFNKPAAAPAPVPERPKPNRVFTPGASAVKPIVPKAPARPAPPTQDDTAQAQDAVAAEEESRRAAEAQRAEQLAREQREKEEERRRQAEQDRLQRQMEEEKREQERIEREQDRIKREQEEAEKLRLRNEEMRKQEHQRMEETEAEERRLKLVEEEMRREEERLHEEQRQLELEMERKEMEMQRAHEEERLRMMEKEAETVANIVASNDNNTVPSYSSGRGLCAKALHDYNAAGDDEISFWEGDVITNIDTSVDDNWWVGSCDNMTGLFPANYVELLPLDGPQDDGAANNGQVAVQQAVALYDYESEDPNDLTFQIDEVLVVERMETEDWWFGSIGQLRQGLFPANHVQLIN